MYIMNYNFMQDKNVLDPSSARLDVVNGAQLSNAIFDHLNVLNSDNFSYSTDIPEEWTSTTIMDADFNGNVNAGNISYSTEDLAGIKIKRRIKGTFAWLTLYDIVGTEPEDLSFTKYDILNKSGVTYEYAIVPYLNDGTEASYIIKEIESKLNGIYVCTPDNIARFYGGMSYGTANQRNNTQVFEPLGNKYPIVITNAETNYYKGSFNATAMTYNQLMSNEFNRYENTNYLNSILKFLSEKNTKIIKDFNGNIWLVSIVDDISTDYDANVGMGVRKCAFQLCGNW